MLLRYPGGKSKGPWSNFIVKVIKEQYRGGVFGELFFGGGGITFKLLKLGVLESICINEKDVSLARLWNSVIKNPSRLRKGIQGVEPTVNLFLHCKNRVRRGLGSGLEALIVNRLSHGGRGTCGGAQGGRGQLSKHKIDSRWNAESLCDDVKECSRLLNSVEIISGACYSSDYRDHLDRVDLVYLDPPYWQVGEGLYLHSFDEKAHLRLHKALSEGRKNWRQNWLLSYNNVAFIRELYREFNQRVGSMAGNKGYNEGSELLITPWEI